MVNRLSVTRPKVAQRKGDLSVFAQSLFDEWRRLGLALLGETVIVAVSGGADSVALLLSLDELAKSEELRLEIHVAHLNHRLRGKVSDADARWVAGLSKKLGYPCSVGSAEVKTVARNSGDNLEQAARRARYAFLAQTARKKRSKIVLTAHTMDDQAETILLNLLRGSGLDGLGGIEPVRTLNPESETLLVRPLLAWARRRDTETYCRGRRIEFRVDEMNADERFARVRVRRRLLPQMESFNPRLVEALSRTAALLREDNSALDAAAARLLELCSEANGILRAGGKTRPSLRSELLCSAPPSLRRRVLRRWLKSCRGDLRRLERVHILSVESLLFGRRGARVIELPGGARVTRRRGHLYFLA